MLTNTSVFVQNSQAVMVQVGSIIWGDESSNKNNDQRVRLLIWIVQNATRWDYTINEMSTHFTDITNNLKSLGTTYTDEEMVKKSFDVFRKQIGSY